MNYTVRLCIGRIVFVLLLPIALSGLLLQFIGTVAFALCEATVTSIIDAKNWIDVFTNELTQ